MAEEIVWRGSTGHTVVWADSLDREIIWGNGQSLSYTAPSFPPSGPVTLTKTLKSYLYVQYNDDDNLQGFVNAQNSLQQSYLDWFVNVNLPIYTGLSGSLLDWVAEGLYGVVRPVLPTGLTNQVGAINTFVTNTIAYNALKRATYTQFFVTTDDVFARVLTWNFYKGDGSQFSIAWLKRRITRFLYGDPVQSTYSVSVTISGSVVTIELSPADGDVYPLPLLAPILQSAIMSGAVQLPFQYTYTVVI